MGMYERGVGLVNSYIACRLCLIVKWALQDDADLLRSGSEESFGVSVDTTNLELSLNCGVRLYQACYGFCVCVGISLGVLSLIPLCGPRSHVRFILGTHCLAELANRSVLIIGEA